jgi:hypothetical protein
MSDRVVVGMALGDVKMRSGYDEWIELASFSV